MCCNNNWNRSSRGCGCGCGCNRMMSRCGCCDCCCCGCEGIMTLPSFPDWGMCGVQQEREMEFPVYISMPATSSRGTASFSAAVERAEDSCGCGRG